MHFPDIYIEPSTTAQTPRNARKSPKNLSPTS